MSPSDSPLVQSQTLRSDGLWEGFAHVDGLTCAACAVELEQESLRISNLREFELNPASGLGRWVATDPQAIEQLATRARKLGYLLGQVDAQGSALSVERSRKFQKASLLRLIVAVLCMMQIMMYSAPEYVYEPDQIGWVETQLLRWAQWVICLPVLLYSAQPLFRAAWLSGRAGRWSVELPVSLGLAIAFGYSSAYLADPLAKMWFDCVAMLVSLLLLSRYLVQKFSAQALERVMAMQPDLPAEVEVWQADSWIVKSVATLKTGELLRLSEGMACPVDVQLEGQAVWMDESMRTGESEPFLRQPGEAVSAGARVGRGVAVGRVVSMNSQGYLSQLGDALHQALARKPVRQLAVERLIPWFSMGVVWVAAGGGLYWWLLMGEPARAVAVLVAVLLVSCPCALALSWPLVRLFAMRRLSQLGVLVRNPEALDTLATVDTLGLDKTGTLTARDGFQVQLDYPSFPNPGNVPPLEPDVIRQYARLLAEQSSHPLARGLVQHLWQAHEGVEQAQPLSPTPECLQVNEYAGLGLEATVTGVQGESHLRLGSPRFCESSLEFPVGSGLTASGGEQGLPTGLESLMCLAVWQGGAWVPLLQARFTPGAALWTPAHMQGLAGRNITLLSGDRAAAVAAWAPELQFTQRLAEQSPQDKADWIRAQQLKGHRVLMCGDGLNDAVAFAQADVSVSSASSASLTARQADVLLLRENPGVLVDVFHTAHTLSRLGQQNIHWALIYNVLALPLALSGVLTPWMASLGMGLSSVWVLVNSARLLRS